MCVHAHPVTRGRRRDVAPDFTLKSLDGKNTRLKEYRGQVVLINFWASWCGPCRQEMPLLEKIDERYKDAGFTVLGVNVEGKSGPRKKSRRKPACRFRCSSTRARRSASCTPSSRCRAASILDRDGVMRYVHRGYKPGDEAKYLEVVKQLISK